MEKLPVRGTPNGLQDFFPTSHVANTSSRIVSSFNLACRTFKAGKTVELTDGSFLFITAVMQDHSLNGFQTCFNDQGRLFGEIRGSQASLGWRHHGQKDIVRTGFEDSEKEKPGTVITTMEQCCAFP